MRKLTLTTGFLLLCLVAMTQALPEEMHLVDGGRQLHTGDKYQTGLYDSSIIRNVYITFPQSNYWTLLQANYASKTNLAASMEIDGITYDSVGVRFKGNTSYTMSGTSQKKSFNVSVDFVHDGQDIDGYNTLNFNNSYGDRSMLRETFYLHQIRRHVPAARSCFIHLYLNGNDWGVYPSVEQLNKDFIEEWFFSNDGANWRADSPTGTGPGGPGGPGGPSWGDGTAALNYLSMDSTDYQEYYTLKSTDTGYPWDKLMDGCYNLNNTASMSMTTVMPAFFDVDRTLWFLASEVAFSDDDSYIMKGKMDYYVYYDPETGRLTPIEYDGNSVMENSAVNWSPFYNATNVNYPLLNKLLAVPAYRQRYLAHLRTIISQQLDVASCTAILDNYKSQIDLLYQADPKKLYSYAQFTNEINNLKTWVNNRRTYLLSNTEVAQTAPAISSVNCYNSSMNLWATAMDMETMHITTQVTSVSGISKVNLYYNNALYGNFTTVEMFDDGSHNDGGAGDGVYGADIPGQPIGTWVRFYVEAVASNSALSVSYMPVGAEHDVYIYQVQPAASGITGVVINEIMASNSVTVADNAGEYEDWIELYNNSSAAIDLSGFFLTDNPSNLDKWEFAAGTSIPANGYLIIWADEDSSQGPASHANFKLSAGGESLWLLDASLNMVDSVLFSAQTPDKGYARVPNGTGNFVIQTATFNSNNNAGTGTTEIENSMSFSVYPNPAVNQVDVRLNGMSGTVPLIVRNALGETVLEKEINSTTRINTGQWDNGIYLFSCNGESKKIIVQH